MSVAAERTNQLRLRIGCWWFVLSCFAIAVIAPFPYLTSSFPDLAKSGVGLAMYYAGQPSWIRATLVVHAATAGVVLLLMPVQALAVLRRRWPRLHRVSGRLSVGLIFVAAPSGLVIAQVSYAGMVGRLGFSSLSVLWLVAGLQTIRTARRRDFVRHREWATRTLALSYAAVTLRLWLLVLVSLQHPIDDVAAQIAFDRVYPLVPFLCWVPNVLFAKWTIRRAGATNEESTRTDKS